MKKLLLSFSLLINVLTLSAQADNRITFGTIDSLNSTILGEKRKIWVYVPDSGPAGLYAVQRYPVVYLLDGDAHFFSVAGMIQQLSAVNGNMICPEMIVVGIPNTDRTRDLTPTHVAADPPFMDSAFSKTSGGGEKFLDFIEKELMPHIDSLYPTQPYKMLIGHSFGGLTAMNAFVNHNKLFNSYICIDPSMWWDHQKLLAATKNKLAENKYIGTSLFLGIANTMDDGMNIKSVRKDTAASSKHIRSILSLRDYFEANKQNGLKFSSKYYSEDTHGSVPLITAYDALRFIFDFYALKLGPADFMDSTDRLAKKLEHHFANVSSEMGYTVAPPENQVNSFGYNALSEKQFKKAESLFKLNVANYPKSANVYDSYGDFFLARGDTANAILQFRKAVSINENPDNKAKLEQLLNKK